MRAFVRTSLALSLALMFLSGPESPAQQSAPFRPGPGRPEPAPTIKGPDSVAPYHIGRYVAPPDWPFFAWRVEPNVADVQTFDGGRGADIAAPPGRYRLTLTVGGRRGKSVDVSRDVTFLDVSVTPNPAPVPPDPGPTPNPAPTTPEPENPEPAPNPPPVPIAPDSAVSVPAAPQGAVGVPGDAADFAGAARMYLRGLPAGWRDVAGQVKAGTIKTDKQLWDAMGKARRKANNGLARRLSRRWAATFDAEGNIIDTNSIYNALIDAAVAAEAGLK